MIKFQPNDYPIDECVKVAEDILSRVNGNGYVQQKWTCRHCNARQTMETKNVFHRSGRCGECKGVTIIDRCNYLVALGRVH